MTYRKYWIAAAAGILTIGAVGQTSANQSVQTSSASANADSQPVLSYGTILRAELSKSVDVRKVKAGEPVEAKLIEDVKSDGQVVLHKGSKLVGHVTEAEAGTKENAESKLGVLFDKAVSKNGQEIAFTGLILAIAPPREGGPTIAGDTNSLSSTAGVDARPFGAGNAVGGPSASAAPAVNSAVGNNLGENGALTSANRGAVDMPGVKLGLSASQGSVISSATHNVKLNNGTQMVLEVARLAATK